MSKKKKYNKPRDENIRKSYERELNLQTKVVKSKKPYSRKPKHKPDYAY